MGLHQLCRILIWNQVQKPENLRVASGPEESNYGRTEREVLLRANFQKKKTKF